MLSLNPLPSLPRYAGPYNVGSTEYEIPISEIGSRASCPDPQMTTIKFRLFYPTDATSARENITWIPRPQKQWIEAFSSFLGASPGWSRVLNPILSVMNHATIPALANAPLRKAQQSKPNALAIFSHGLAGNHNMYSAICGSLASCGVICAAPEHRDGSSPIAWIRGPDGEVESEVAYQKYPHHPSAEVFDGRNAQLRIRMWELDLFYTALIKLNEGQNLTNYASSNSAHPSFKASMDLSPGHVSWLGHSFGAATITQFIKSVYYHTSLPSPSRPEKSDGSDWTPLYKPCSESILVKQITPNSPVALLDVWTLPLRAPSAEWLWEKPFPCYDRKPSADTKASTVALMSGEFFNYTDMKKRTRALLSPDPVQAERQLAAEAKVEAASPGRPPPPSSPHISTPPHKENAEKASNPPFEADTLPAPTLSPSAETSILPPSSSSTRESSPSSLSSSTNEQHHSPSSSTTSVSTPSASAASNQELVAPKLFTIPQSAHLSQSDFGLLFPTLTRYLMKAIDPEGTIILNVRAITAVIRHTGLDVRRIDAPKPDDSRWFGRWRAAAAPNPESEPEPEGESVRVLYPETEDRILSGDNKDVQGTGGRWVQIPLVF